MLLSCKSDNNALTTAADSDKLAIAKSKLSENGNVQNASQYLMAIRTAIGEPNADKNQLLTEGLAVAEQYKLGPQAVSFLMPLIKDYNTDPQTAERMAKLASALQDLNRPAAAAIVAQGYLAKYPEGPFGTSLLEKIGKQTTTPQDRLQAMAEEVFVNPDKYGINKASAQRYVDACEAFALAYPTDSEAPMYLYRGAEMARTLRTFTKALSIYDWIEEKYPDFEKTPTTMFLKGFMLENDLNNKQKAKEVYNTFLAKYPNHDLADDIKFLIQNIDKSDKEIMEMIESKKKGQ